MSSIAKTRSEPVIYSLTRHYSVSWARQLATMSPLKHSLPKGAHGKLYVSTKRIMPWSLLINPRRQPPFLWIQITTYPLTVWDNSEKLYKDRTSQLRPHHFRLCFDLIRGWKTSGDFLLALLFLFSRFSRVSDALCYALLLKTRAIIIVPTLTFHRWYNSTVLWRHVAFTWYHGNALATTAPRKCRKWLLNIFDYKERKQLHSSAAMSFSNACNEVVFFSLFDSAISFMCVLLLHSWLRQFCCFWSCNMNTCPKHPASSWLQRFLWAWQQRNMKTTALEWSLMFGVSNNDTCLLLFLFLLVFCLYN